MIAYLIINGGGPYLIWAAINLLLYCLVIALLWWALQGFFNVPEPIRRIIVVILILLAVALVLAK